MRYIFMLFMLFIPLSVSGQNMPMSKTECGERNGKAVGVVWLRMDMLATNEAPMFVAHESAHKQIIEMFDTCAEYEAWLHTDNHAALDEAFAHWMHAQALIVHRGYTLDEAIAQLSPVLAAYDELRLTADDAAALIRFVGTYGVTSEVALTH